MRAVPPPAFLLMAICVLVAGRVFAAEPAPGATLFRESFEDAELLQRGWYDGAQFRIVGGAWAGAGCLEYEWTAPNEKVSGSSGVRRGFEPVDGIFIRYYLKLSKGWAGRDGIIIRTSAIS